MKTPQTIKVLTQIMERSGWTQQDLADATGLLRSTVGHHLIATRPIRDEHIVTYLRTVPAEDRPSLFAAWLNDLFIGQPALVEALLESGRTRIHSDVSTWAPGLTEEQQRWLNYWASQMRIDPTAADFLGMITLRDTGFKDFGKE